MEPAIATQLCAPADLALLSHALLHEWGCDQTDFVCSNGLYDLSAYHPARRLRMLVSAVCRADMLTRLVELLDSAVMEQFAKVGWLLQVHGWTHGQDDRWRCKVAELTAIDFDFSGLGFSVGEK